MIINNASINSTAIYIYTHISVHYIKVYPVYYTAIFSNVLYYVWAFP